MNNEACMNLKILSIALLSFGLALAQGGAVIGYYPYWAQYSQFTPKNVHFERVSELHYASLTPSADGSIALADETDAANFDSLVTASAAHHVPLVAVIGGPDAGDAFAAIAADESLRSAFVKNVSDWVDSRGLSGVELDWQNPAADNATGYRALVRALKSGLNGKTLGAAAYPASVEVYGDALNEADDVIVFVGDHMTTDSSTVRPNMSLDDVKSAMDIFASKGIAKSKLIPVIALSGKSFSGATGFGSAHQGPGSGNDGYIPYKDLMTKFDTPDYKVTFDETSSSELAVGNGEAIVFSGIPSVRAISVWIRDNGFGGVALYDVSEDHPEAIISLLVTAGQVLRPDVDYAPQKKK